MLISVYRKTFYVQSCLFGHFLFIYHIFFLIIVVLIPVEEKGSQVEEKGDKYTKKNFIRFQNIQSFIHVSPQIVIFVF